MSNKKIADGINYFGETGFPVTIRRVRTNTSHRPSHSHDLTEVEHCHDFCELVIVSHGSAIHNLKGHEFPVSAGDVFLLQGRQSHYFCKRNDLVLTNVMYDPVKLKLPDNDLRKLPGYSAVFLLEPSYRKQHRFASRLHLKRVSLAHVELIAERMEKECLAQDPGWEVSVRASLLEMMVYLSRAYTTTDTIEAYALLRVGHVIGALENNFTNDWTLKELVDISNMSRSNLMRIFRKATGQTPIEYLIRLRIQKAMELLRNSNMNITEIAMRTGFNDSNYFARQFRAATGVSPSKFIHQ